MACEGVAANARVAQSFGSQVLPNVPITELFAVMTDLGHRVAGGDLSDVERILTAQIVALNAAFTGSMQQSRAATTLEGRESYMRLALRSQSQCRATAETIATMKMPPVFAKQANFASGPQQVNNGDVSRDGRGSRARVTVIPQNKLLASGSTNERVDRRTSRTSAGRDSVVEAVAALDRPAKRRR